MVDLQAAMLEEAANMWESVRATRAHANLILLLLGADGKDSQLQDGQGSAELIFKPSTVFFVVLEG